MQCSSCRQIGGLWIQVVISPWICEFIPWEMLRFYKKYKARYTVKVLDNKGNQYPIFIISLRFASIDALITVSDNLISHQG
jgi:hypothetical protein